MYLFDLTKINCSVYLIVKSLYHIIEMCKIKYFICGLVSMTKKLRPLQAKIKYQCAHNKSIIVTETGSQIKYLILDISII